MALNPPVTQEILDNDSRKHYLDSTYESPLAQAMLDYGIGGGSAIAGGFAGGMLNIPRTKSREAFFLKRLVKDMDRAGINPQQHAGILKHIEGRGAINEVPGQIMRSAKKYRRAHRAVPRSGRVGVLGGLLAGGLLGLGLNQASERWI